MKKIQKCVVNSVCVWLFGMASVGGAEPLPNDYYDPRPAPSYIVEQLGPFGPRTTEYAIPKGAIFVAPDGKKTNSGASIEEPMTIEQAIREAKTDQVIVMRGGLYRTGDLTFDKKITVQAYPGERPVIKGTEIASNWEKRGEYWVTQWDTMFYKKPPGFYRPERHGPPCVWNGDLVLFDGRMFRPANSLADVQPGFFFCDYEAGEIYLVDDPTDKVVEITAHEVGFHRTHGPEADLEGPTFLGLDVLGYAAYCICIDGERARRELGMYEMLNSPVKSRIEECRIMYCSFKGVYMVSPDSTVANNEISFHGWTAIDPRTSHRLMFEHNRVHFSNMYRHPSFPAGIKVFNQGHRCVVRNNYFADMPCIAVWYDVGLKENIVVNNYFNNCGISIKIEISHKSYLAGNVMDGSRVFICNSANCLMFNNTLIDSCMDFMRNDRGSRFSEDSGWHHENMGPGEYNYHGHQIANNVFAGSHPQRNLYHLIEDSNEFDPHFQWDLHSCNLYLSEAVPAVRAEWLTGKMEMTDYAIWADFEASDPYGAYVDRNVQLSISQDELFQSKEAGDYRLKDVEGLPEGMVIPVDILDMLGWDVGTKGIGALLQEKSDNPEKEAPHEE